MAVPSSSCPWCAAFAANQVDELGTLRLPVAVLPSELCARCQKVRRQLYRRRVEVMSPGLPVRYPLS